MPYITLEQLKRYKDIEELNVVDDLLLEECLDRAQSHIDETHRCFQAEKGTRFFDVPDDETLLVDFDLLKIIKLGNGDGTLISDTDYRLRPANLSPKHEIVLVNGAYWTYTDTPIQAIAVRAWWGYSYQPPADIQQALVRLTAFFYKQKDSQVFDTAGFVDGGVLVLPEGVPKYVAEKIAYYTRKI